MSKLLTLKDGTPTSEKELLELAEKIKEIIDLPHTMYDSAEKYWAIQYAMDKAGLL